MPFLLQRNYPSIKIKERKRKKKKVLDIKIHSNLYKSISSSPQNCIATKKTIYTAKSLEKEKNTHAHTHTRQFANPESKKGGSHPAKDESNNKNRKQTRQMDQKRAVFLTKRRKQGINVHEGRKERKKRGFDSECECRR